MCFTNFLISTRAERTILGVNFAHDCFANRKRYSSQIMQSCIEDLTSNDYLLLMKEINCSAENAVEKEQCDLSKRIKLLSEIPQGQLSYPLHIIDQMTRILRDIFQTIGLPEERLDILDRVKAHLQRDLQHQKTLNESLQLQVLDWQTKAVIQHIQKTQAQMKCDVLSIYKIALIKPSVE